MIITKFRAKIAAVPNVEAIAREMTTTSQVGIILNRVRLLRFSSLIKIGLNNLPYILKIARKDFAVGIKVLTELEILRLMESDKGKKIALHQQMVDMAIALKNANVIKYFLIMSHQYGFKPYLVTANVGSMIKLLSKIHNVPLDLSIITDIDSSNDGLKEYMQRSSLHFINSMGEN